ncbi:MAG: hypothetical protein M3Y39_10190 [Chloroflexota bacterium]|nr:hypothetical protein [Chloroflexota bacterium]
MYALSAEIYQFAEANRLGDPIASYEMRPRIIRRYSGPLHITIALFGFGLFALVTAIYLCTQAFTPTTTWDDVRFLAALPFCSALAFLLFLTYHSDITYQKTSLTVCERGLLGYNESTRDVTAILWDTIESVWCDVARVYSSDAGDKRRRFGWKYVFQCNDGQRFAFSGYEGAFALSYVVDREINARLLPGAIAAYDAGRTVSFGAIQISQEGLQVGHKAIPWQNILSIEMEGEQIIVRLPDWQSWVGNSKAATPNVSVLKALIQYISAGEKNLMDVNGHPDLVFSHKRIEPRKRKHSRYKPRSRSS